MEGSGGYKKTIELGIINQMFKILRFVLSKINLVLFRPQRLKSTEEGRESQGTVQKENSPPSQKILLISGLSLLLLGMIYGGIYGAFFLENIHETEAEQMGKSIYYASEGDFSSAEKYHEKSVETASLAEMLKSAHAHLNSFSVIMLVIACNLPNIKMKEKWKIAAAIVFVIGTLLFPAGIILQPLVNKGLGKIISIIGGTGIMASTTVYLWGAVKAGYKVARK